MTGGYALPGKGFFIKPTIIRDVKDGDEIVDEEQFGPVLPVVTYSDVEQAVAGANRLKYGLAASVWSADVKRARDIAMRIESGTVWINTHLDVSPVIPYAGAKQSGFGVEFSVEGLHEFTQIKVVHQVW